LNKKPRNKRRTWAVIAAIVVVVVAIVLSGLFFVRNKIRAATAAQPAQVVTAFTGNLQTSGTLLAMREAQLSLETSGRVDKVWVQVGDAVRAGDALVQLESDQLQLQVQDAAQDLQIQQANLDTLNREAKTEDIKAAQAARDSAQAKLDDLLAGPRPEDLAKAEAALASAQAQLEDLLAGPDSADLASARASLANAKGALQAAQAQYAVLDDQLTVARRELDYAKVTLENAEYFYNALANDWQHKDYAPFSPEADVLKDAKTNYEVALARYNLNKANINDSAVRSAESQVAQAEANLTALTKEKTVQIAQARAQVAQSEAYLDTLTTENTAQIASARDQLAQAEANLSGLLQGASEEQKDAAKAQVEQAGIALENARSLLEKTTLKAPFDGIVTAIQVNPGEWASGRAVDMLDPSSFEVVLDVDEVDVGSVSVGQPAQVTLETWPDQVLEGKVLSIDPQANNAADIVSYPVHLSLVPGDLPIRAGMTANGELVTADLQNVLLVPSRAITADRQTGKYYVSRQQGQEVVQVEVKIGLRDNNNTQILEGLQAGDQLVIYQERSLDLLSGPPSGVR
jgi:HlyD family secretion protein